jgi:hypothetical protein
MVGGVHPPIKEAIVQDSTRAAPRIMGVAALALAVLALAMFAWLAGGATAGAAGTSTGGGSATSGQLQPVQTRQDGQDAPADRDGHPCPDEQGGSGQGSGSGSGAGSSGEQDAPATADPATPL